MSGEQKIKRLGYALIATSHSITGGGALSLATGGDKTINLYVVLAGLIIGGIGTFFFALGGGKVPTQTTEDKPKTDI